MPEFWVKDKKVAETPDETGIFQTAIGELEVDMSGIDPTRQHQVLKFRNKGQEYWYQVDMSAQGVGSYHTKFGPLELRLHQAVRDNEKWREVKLDKPQKIGERVAYYRWEPLPPL